MNLASPRDDEECENVCHPKGARLAVYDDQELILHPAYNCAMRVMLRAPDGKDRPVITGER